MNQTPSSPDPDLPWDFSDLRAAVVNRTLKPSPGRSHTQGLLDRSIGVMDRNGIAVDVVRAVDHDLPPGVYPDMREHGFETDGWPDLFERIIAADILILGTPTWLGDKSSVCSRVIRRRRDLFDRDGWGGRPRAGPRFVVRRARRSDQRERDDGQGRAAGHAWGTRSPTPGFPFGGALLR